MKARSFIQKFCKIFSKIALKLFLKKKMQKLAFLVNYQKHVHMYVYMYIYIYILYLQIYNNPIFHFKVLKVFFETCNSSYNQEMYVQTHLLTDHMKFLGVLNKQHMEITGLFKTSGISRGDQEYRIFIGLGFYWGISRDESVDNCYG